LEQAPYTLCAIDQREESAPSPREHWSEAEFLAEGFAANLAIFTALQFRCRLSDEQAAKLCGVSPRTYRRWRSTGKPNAGCVRLLSVLAGCVL
jgi:hypothetical protein